VAAKQTYTYLQSFRRRPFLRLVTQEVFNLLNTQVLIPVSFTVKSWDLELGYTLNLPNAVANESNLPTTGFLNLTIGYFFDFKR